MVYKIFYRDITNINNQFAYIIAISVDGEFALISSSEELSEQIIDEQTMKSMMSSEEWKQPCINC